MRGAGSGPPRRRHRHKNPEALEVYYKAILRSKNRRVCELPVSLSGSGHSASNKIDCLFSLQTGSSWAPAAPAPKSQRLVPARVRALVVHQRPPQMSASVSRGVWVPSGSPHPRSVEARPPPSCGFCSVARPELQGPLSCWPGAPSAPLAVASAGAAPGSPPRGGRPRSPLSMILPRWSHGLGCLGRLFWGEGSDIYFIFFVAATRQVLMPRGLSAPGGRCRGPIGCSPGSLRSNWPPPPGPGSSRRPCAGS